MVGLPLRTSPTLKTIEPNDRVTNTTVNGSRMPNYGKTLLTTSSTGIFLLEDPIPGVRKVIVQTSTSTTARTVTGKTTTIFFATATANNVTLTFDAVGDLIELEGRTALIWDVISNQNVTLS